MAINLARASRPPIKAVRLSAVDEVRAALPVSLYVKLLHDAATTGYMPKLDVRGRPTGQFDALETKQRIEIARYLIDKRMPDAPKEIINTTNHNAAGPEEFRTMSDADLLRIANATDDDVDLDESAMLETGPAPVADDASASPLLRPLA